jgi:uncharacterized hydrophobic protein (TIGR00271 family)
MFNKSFTAFLNTHFNLNEDRDDEVAIIDSVTRGAELKGANLWVLIFAIIIASIGLNVNSTAVIIGAMLISPLMGPLIAIGLGLGINDFEIIKSALKNLGLAVVASLIASTLYFLITPLSQAQTEILARTSPTIFDVFIALAGGLAGMVATTRKVKGNVIPGVAIATALMPPLCTAGYGIASGNWMYFFGAFYLFFINCVFIFLGSYLVVRMLHFQSKHFVDKTLELRIRRYIYIMIMLTVLPSTYLAYNMVTKSLTERNINSFLSSEVNSRGFVILDKKVSHKEGKVLIELSTLGAEINEETSKRLNERLVNYKLPTAQIVFKRLLTDKTEMMAMKSAIIEELYKNNEQAIREKDTKIALLEQQLKALRFNNFPAENIKKELKIIIPSMEDLLLSKAISENESTILLAYMLTKEKLPAPELQKAREWLKARTQASEVKLMHEQSNRKMIKAAGR